MNHLDNNHFNRRRFLYGAGGGMMALPWLETVAVGASVRVARTERVGLTPLSGIGFFWPGR